MSRELWGWALAILLTVLAARALKLPETTSDSLSQPTAGDGRSGANEEPGDDTTRSDGGTPPEADMSGAGHQTHVGPVEPPDEPVSATVSRPPPAAKASGGNDRPTRKELRRRGPRAKSQKPREPSDDLEEALKP